MIDSNERLTFLDSRHTTNLAQRVVDTVLKDYVKMKENNNQVEISSTLQEERARATKNKLFLKFAAIDYEGLFYNINIERKVTG